MKGSYSSISHSHSHSGRTKQVYWVIKNKLGGKNFGKISGGITGERKREWI